MMSYAKNTAAAAVGGQTLRRPVKCVPQMKSIWISRRKVIKFWSQQNVILRLNTTHTWTDFQSTSLKTD